MIKMRCKVPNTEADEPGSAKWRCRTKVGLDKDGTSKVDTCSKVFTAKVGSAKVGIEKLNNRIGPEY